MKADTSFLAKYQVDPSTFDTLPKAPLGMSSDPVIDDANLALGDAFQPAKDDILAGRGRQCYNHEGNKRFQEIVQKNKAKYTKARNRMEKSLIVDHVLEQVRNLTPSSGFIKKNSKTGQWFRLDSTAAREKCAHAMRDAIAPISEQTKGGKPKNAVAAKKGKKASRDAKSAVKFLPNKAKSCPVPPTTTRKSTLGAATHQLTLAEAISHQQPSFVNGRAPRPTTPLVTSMPPSYSNARQEGCHYPTSHHNMPTLGIANECAFGGVLLKEQHCYDPRPINAENVFFTTTAPFAQVGCQMFIASPDSLESVSIDSDVIDFAKMFLANSEA